MPRPLRIDPEGARHHVMNRGVDHMNIFRSDRDRRTFLSRLGDALDNTGVVAEAYCLMGNHFHLLLHCPQAGLSQAMRQLGAEYAQTFNHRHGRDGPVFRGRFQSKVVDNDRYLAAVASYIHRNPRDIGVDPLGWTWSSYAPWLDRALGPAWLRVQDAREIAGGAEAHRRLVERERWVAAGAEAEVNPASVHAGWLAGECAAMLPRVRHWLDQHFPDLSARQQRYALILAAIDHFGLRRDDIVSELRLGSRDVLKSSLRRARQERMVDPELAGVVRSIPSADLLAS